MGLNREMAAVAGPSNRSLNPEPSLGRENYSTLEPVIWASEDSVPYHAPRIPVAVTAIDGSQPPNDGSRAPIPYVTPSDGAADKEAVGFGGELGAGRDTSKTAVAGRPWYRKRRWISGLVAGVAVVVGLVVGLSVGLLWKKDTVQEPE